MAEPVISILALKFQSVDLADGVKHGFAVLVEELVGEGFGVPVGDCHADVAIGVEMEDLVAGGAGGDFFEEACAGDRPLHLQGVFAFDEDLVFAGVDAREQVSQIAEAQVEFLPGNGGL